MSKIEQIANDLYYYNGGDTAQALSRSFWNDGVGTGIKDRIETIVDNAMAEARSGFAHRLNTIKTEDIENALQLARTHLHG